MKQKISWIADVDSSKVSVIKIIQFMSASKPGKYLLGKGRSNCSPYVVGVYFDDTVLFECRPTQSSVIGYIDP